MNLNINFTSCSEESSSSEDDQKEDTQDPRTIATEDQLLEYDPSFNKKKWRKLKPHQQRTLSAILHLTKEEMSGKSNASLTIDRKAWITACRGLYYLSYNFRKSLDTQDEQTEVCGEMYKMSTFYPFGKILPKVFSLSAVRKYILTYNTVYLYLLYIILLYI